MALKDTSGKDQGWVERVTCHFLYVCMLPEAEVASGRRKDACEIALIGSNQKPVHLPRAATFEVFCLGPLRSKLRPLWTLPYTFSLYALSLASLGFIPMLSTWKGGLSLTPWWTSESRRKRSKRKRWARERRGVEGRTGREKAQRREGG